MFLSLLYSLMKSDGNSPTNSISRRKTSGLGECGPEAEAAPRRSSRAGGARVQTTDASCGELGGVGAGGSA